MAHQHTCREGEEEVVGVEEVVVGDWAGGWVVDMCRHHM